MEKQLARMRTIKACLSEIKLLDKGTAITEWLIGSICKDNKVKHYFTGKKILVNLDDLLRYLRFEPEDEVQ